MKYANREIGGIYTIRNKINGKVYIGSATSFYYRWAEHKSKLQKCAHANQKLQRAWNKYTESSFDFLVLEEIQNKSTLLEAEQFYIDVFFGPNCYNILPKAESRLGAVYTEKDKEKWVKHKDVLLISPIGEIHRITNLKSFAKLHNLHYTALLTVVNKTAKHHCGWRLPDTKLTTYSLANANGTVITLIGGELETFSELHGLNPKALKRVALGTQKWHNGWYAVCVIGKVDNTPGMYLRGNYGNEIILLGDKVVKV